MNDCGLAIDAATLFIREMYHEISPEESPAASYAPGRPLNVEDEESVLDEDTTVDGHRIVYVNQIFSDNDGNNFRVIDMIGNGTYSYVFKCQILADPYHFVALKIIKNQPQYRQAAIREIEIHRYIDNSADMPGKEHVITSMSTFEINGHIFIVMPLLQRSLFNGICQQQPVIQLLDSIRQIMTQILQALHFLHINGVMHGDIKSDNILFIDEGKDDVAIIDFGSATTEQGQIGQYIQSRFYRSPEIILGLPYSSKVDIWSAGCIAAELFLDFAIFACDCEYDIIHTIVFLLGPFAEELLQASKNWWKFYDISTRGFELKSKPENVILERHLNHEAFERTGVQPLHDLIINHFELSTPEEFNYVLSFSQFVHYLLSTNAIQRPNAAQALNHPFIKNEQIINQNWAPSYIQQIPTALPNPVMRVAERFGDEDIFSIL